MKILFVAGGSIGHIAPCVAVWRALQKEDPAASALFVCATRKEESDFLTKEGVRFAALAGRSVRWNLPLVTWKAWNLLRREKPDAVFTKGGGVTVPVALAAWLLRIPIVVHESDAVPGKATTFISRFAKMVCHGFPVSSEKLKMKNEKLFFIFNFSLSAPIYTGNPLRPGIASGSRERGLSLTGFSGDRPVLLIMGGSQGAATVNAAVRAHIDELLRHADIIHLTGEGKAGAGERPGYWSRPFVQNELPDLYAAADMAVSRAGAGSIGELAANGIPSVLIPLEGVAHDHQVKNARALAASGACVLLPQAALTKDLATTVSGLAGSPGRRKALADAMRRFTHPDAAMIIARLLREAGR